MNSPSGEASVRPGRTLSTRAILLACRRSHQKPTRDLLIVSVASQQLHWCRRDPRLPLSRSPYATHRTWRISTSRFGTGAVRDSQRTPLGLHRIARKIGAGWPVGTVFKARQPIGYLWQESPGATIAHRILWLEGLEPRVNRDGNVDTFQRYIYIHGLGDEPSLGRPASHGCIHLAAADLMPLFDQIAVGTLVWITPGR